MKSNIKTNIKTTSNKGKGLSPKVTTALALAAVAAGTVGAALALSSASAPMSAIIIFPH